MISSRIKPSQNYGYHEENLVKPEYYEIKYRNTLREWEKFIESGKTIDTNIIPQDIADSWVRSREMGLDPLKKPQPLILTGQDLQALLGEYADFINISRVFMNYLYRFIKSSHFSVSLFNAQGFLLETIVRDEYEESIRKGNWVVGSLWDEANIGNNIVGTVLEIKKPLRIFGPQHYNKAYHRHIAFSAPIFNPERKFIGGIAVTGYYYWAANPHTLGMTVASAKAIENELQSQKAMRETQIANSYQKTVIASIPEAIITIDHKSNISLINDNAKMMLDLEDRSVEGRHISHIFGVGNRQFLNLVEHNDTITDVEVRIASKMAANDYTLTCKPIYSPEGENLGKIIILNEIKRVKTLVTKMIGAKANFQFKDIYGQNSKFLKTIEQAKMVSRSTSNALLLGKSGTGKDIFAQAIHNASNRKNGPYVAINCAAIPRDLITSELFGYSEGAFTGSRRGGNQGKFELADGGTIFLDEIAETPLELQAVLLRVIEDKSIIRIGGKRVRPVNVRIIAATNKDLREEVRKGNFREDLYYRLNVFAIHLVPLSERVEDIPLLMDCFIAKYRKILDKKVDRVDPGVLDVLMRYPWPGNVRELQNVMERMINFARTSDLTMDLIPSDILEYKSTREENELIDQKNKQRHADYPIRPLPDENKRFAFNPHAPSEREVIAKMLELGIKQKKIAEKMNLSRVTIYRKMKKYQLN